MPAQIAPGLWVFPSRSLAYNAGVFLRAGQALLIDPGPHPDETDAMAAFVTDRGATIAAIVLTHSHWDHLLGPERLPAAPIVAQARYPATAARDAEAIAREVARWEQQHGQRRAAPFVIPSPDRLVGDAGALVVGGASLQLIHIPGHANDQLAIFCPDEGWLWAADTLSDIEIPFVSESLAEYELALARLADVPASMAVPGHGSPARTPAEVAVRLNEDRVYLTALRAGVEAGLAAGVDLETVRAACAAISLKNESENRGAHRLNVESAFIELGGAADPTLVGWHQEGLFGA